MEEKEEKPKKRKIKCEALRAIGLEDRTAVKGEEVMLDRDVAKKLQDVFAVKIVI